MVSPRDHMAKTLWLSPFIMDVVLTTVTSITTAVSLLLATRFLAQGLGPEAFGAYSLARRALATMAPLSTLAMGVAIARYLAVCREANSRDQFLLGGLMLSIGPSLAVSLIGVVYLDPLSTLIFHGPGYSTVAMAVLFTLIGYSFYTVLYASYRGRGQMWKANLWQLAVIALGPLIIAARWAKTGQVAWILFLMGALYFTTVVPLGASLSKALVSHGRDLGIGGAVKELFRYSLPRVPGGLALASMFAIGPFLAPYVGSITDVGHLVAGQSVFALTGGGNFGLWSCCSPEGCPTPRRG
jgi:O-antigen/teichoic acid export membrane protein